MDFSYKLELNISTSKPVVSVREERLGQTSLQEIAPSTLLHWLNSGGSRRRTSAISLDDVRSFSVIRLEQRTELNLEEFRAVVEGLIDSTLDRED